MIKIRDCKYGKEGHVIVNGTLKNRSFKQINHNFVSTKHNPKLYD